jgi:hypothetical protein
MRSLGFQFGPNWTNIRSKDISENNTQSRIGILGGISYSQYINNRIFIGVDLLYNQKGFSSIILLYNGTNDPTPAEYNFYHNYLTLPLKAGVSIGKTINGFANIGIVPSFLVSSKVIYPIYESGKFIRTETEVTTDFVDRSDFSGLLEIGGGYKINAFYLYTSISYQLSFVSMTNQNYLSNLDIRQQGIALSVGLKFLLTQ